MAGGDSLLPLHWVWLWEREEVRYLINFPGIGCLRTACIGIVGLGGNE